MKTIVAALLLGSWTFAAKGQGTVVFYNYDSPYMDAPVYESDRVTAVFGSQFTAALLAGPSSNSLSQVATAGFIRAGYYFGGLQTINGVFPRDAAWVQIEVWNTASGVSFTQAQASGLPNSWWQSQIFSVTTGGGGVNPFPPGSLVGLSTSPVFLNGVVPEPSTLALCLVAGVMAAIRSRGKGLLVCIKANRTAKPTLNRTAARPFAPRPVALVRRCRLPSHQASGISRVTMFEQGINLTLAR